MNRRSVLASVPVAFATGLLPGAETKPIKLVAYNIKRGFGMDNRTDLDRTIAYLDKLKPDLLALQEVDQNCRRSGKVDQAVEIGKGLGMESSFHKFMDFDGGEYGLAVLSRLPIQETRTHALPEGGEPRVAGELEVKTEAGPISFVSLHLDWTTTARRLPQAKALTKALEKRTHPVVLAGDFNAKPNSPTMKHFGETYTIVPKEGDPLTFPSDKPKIEIDFFAVRNFEKPEGLRSKVLAEEVVSDHRPVVMDL